MRPEVLLKAYVEYQSEDAFRDLVAGTLDEVYSTSFRIVHGAPHLAEQIALSVYSELARKAPGLLSEQVVLASWLRERTCKMAVSILRAEDRAIDWAVLKREKKALLNPADVRPAPPGVAIHVSQTIFMSAARRKPRGLFSNRVWLSVRMRPLHVCGAAICVLVMIVWCNNPFHRRNPIIRSQGPQMMPSSFAQLAGPMEGGPSIPSRMANTNSITIISQK